MVFDNNTNQIPSDNNFARDILHHDRKTESLSNNKIDVDMIYPNTGEENLFSAGEQISIPIIVQIDEGRSDVEFVRVYVNNEWVTNLTEQNAEYQSNRYVGQITGISSGTNLIRVVAFDNNARELASSKSVQITGKPFTGSLPPSFALLFEPPFTQITSTSTIPLSMQAYDDEWSNRISPILH